MYRASAATEELERKRAVALKGVDDAPDLAGEEHAGADGNRVQSAMPMPFRKMNDGQPIRMRPASGGVTGEARE
jgi:hypothetical protein